MMTWDNPILPLLLALVIISGIVIPLLIVLVSYIRMNLDKKKKGKIKKRRSLSSNFIALKVGLSILV